MCTKRRSLSNHTRNVAKFLRDYIKLCNKTGFLLDSSMLSGPNVVTTNARRKERFFRSLVQESLHHQIKADKMMW